MALVEPYTQLRTHLERCRILLDTLYNRREESCSEATLHVMSAMDDIRNAITKTIKGAVAYKNDADVRFDFNGIKPAKIIHEKVEYPGDAEIIKAEMKEYAKPEPVKRAPTVYHVDPKLNKLLQAYCEMGGASLNKLVKPFSIAPPSMELVDFFGFVQEIKGMRESNGLYSDCAVYGHVCEYSTFYVGIARKEFQGRVFADLGEAVQARLHEHRNWPSVVVKANWTAINKVVSCLFYFPGNEEDENLITQLMVHYVGDRVRGGKFTWIGPIDFPSTSSEELKDTLRKRSIK